MGRHGEAPWWYCDLEGAAGGDMSPGRVGRLGIVDWASGIGRARNFRKGEGGEQMNMDRLIKVAERCRFNFPA
jgi:hypothetical protein